VVSANAWSASIPVAAAVLPDDGYRVTANVSNKAGIPAPPDTQTWKRRESQLRFTPGQAREIKRSIVEQQLIFNDVAIELIKKRLGITTGYAQKLLRDARNSGEVRCINDNGINKGDLIGWLDRHPPQTSKPATPKKGKVHNYRHAGDAALVARGLKMVTKGMTNSEAARQLAPQATGGTELQRIDRLRRLIGALAVIGTAKDSQS
jgi:hypothetical protein